MAMTAEQYLSQLQALLPPGAAWPRDRHTELARTLLALADEFARVEESACRLIEEADPRTTSDLLPEWEKDAALPDPYAGEVATVQERRIALLAKLLASGGQSPHFYIDLAAQLGTAITITEFRPFVAGSRAGDALYNTADWGITWQVNIPAGAAYKHFVAGSRAGEPLLSGSNQLLEWAIGRLKPAHTRVIFNYI